MNCNRNQKPADEYGYGYENETKRNGRNEISPRASNVMERTNERTNGMRCMGGRGRGMNRTDIIRNEDRTNERCALVIDGLEGGGGIDGMGWDGMKIFA